MKKLNDCIELYVDYVNNPELRASTPAQYQVVKNKYNDLALPYAEQKRENVVMTYEVSVTQFIECMKTFAVGVNFLKDNPGTNYFMEFQKSIMSILGGGDPAKTLLMANIPIFLLLARKPGPATI